MNSYERLNLLNTYRQHSVQQYDWHQDSYFEGWIALFQPLINLYSYPYSHWHLYLQHHQLGLREVRCQIPDHYVIHLLRRQHYFPLESLRYWSSAERSMWRNLVYHSCRELHQFEDHHCHFNDYFRLSFNINFVYVETFV